MSISDMSSVLTWSTFFLLISIGCAQCYNCHTAGTPCGGKMMRGRRSAMRAYPFPTNCLPILIPVHVDAASTTSFTRPISIVKSDIIRKRPLHDAHAPHSSLTGPTSASNTPGTPSEPFSQTQRQTPSASPRISRRPTPSPLPILAPDSAAQPVAVTLHVMSVVALGESTVKN